MGFRAPYPLNNPWIVAAPLILATFGEVLDFSLVTIALPRMSESFSAGMAGAVWIATAYLIGSALAIPAIPWAVAFFGRTRLLTSAILLFTCASVLCGLAPALGILVLLRGIQGIMGSILIVVAQPIVIEVFDQPRRGSAMAVYGMALVLAPVVGPVIGGAIVQHVHWRFLFLVNVPIGLVSLGLVSLVSAAFGPSAPDIRSNKLIDLRSFAILLLGLGAAQVLLTVVPAENHSALLVGLPVLLIWAATLLGVTRREMRAGEPLVNLGLLRSRAFSAGLVLLSILASTLYASTFLLPFFLQSVYGDPAEAAGVVLASRGLGTFLAMPVVGLASGRLGSRAPLTVGLIGSAAAFYWVAHLQLVSSSRDLVLPLLFMGITSGFTWVPLSIGAFGLLRSNDVGEASRLFNTVRNLAAAFGVPAAAAFVSARADFHTRALAANAGIDPARIGLLFRHLPAGPVPPLHQAMQNQAMQAIPRQAGFLACMDLFQWIALVTAGVLPFVFYLGRRVASDDRSRVSSM